MWIIQFADAVLPGSFTGFGLRSWDLSGLAGIVLGPLLHADWAHLIANSVPLLVLGCLVAVEGARRFWAVTAIVAIIGGAGTWLAERAGSADGGGIRARVRLLRLRGDARVRAGPGSAPGALCRRSP